MKALIARYGELALGLLLVLVYVGSVAAWLAYEDAALEAERRYRDLERLLVIVVKAVEAERDKRGDGGAGSRTIADRPGDCGCGSQGHLPAGAGGAGGRDGGSVSGPQKHDHTHDGPGTAGRLSIAE